MTRSSTTWLRALDDHGSLDLDPVVDLIGEARIVALGEGAHNIQEFLEARNQLLRALVVEHGFTAVVTESGFAEALAVDAFVQGGPGDATVVARQAISYRFGECEPAVEQLRWLREHNRASGVSGPVHWYGMDLPGDSASPEAAVRACLAGLEPAASDRDLLRLIDIGRRAHAATRWEALTADDRDRVYDGINDVIRRALADGNDVLRHCARSLKAFLAESQWASASDDRRPYPRDVFMAETVRWVLERHDRALVCAHNGHVQRRPVDARATAGSMLAEQLGDSLVVIGQTYGAGPEVRIRERSERAFNWDVELAEHHIEPGSLEDLVERELSGAADATTYLVLPTARGAAVPNDVAGAFDGVVHHRQVRHVEGAFYRLREDLEDA